jgi:hypothetical protein
MATSESLPAQEGIEQHNKHNRMLLVVVDGQVEGKRLTKSTDRILVEDIFEPEKEEQFPICYESWDGVINGIYARSAVRRGLPYVCLVKTRNRASVTVSFLFALCPTSTNLATRIPEHPWERLLLLIPRTFQDAWNRQIWVAHWRRRRHDLQYDMNNEMHLNCIQDERLIGCSGLTQVGFRTGKWNLCKLCQNAEYIRAQCLRRMDVFSWGKTSRTRIRSRRTRISCVMGGKEVVMCVFLRCPYDLSIKWG